MRVDHRRIGATKMEGRLNIGRARRGGGTIDLSWLGWKLSEMLGFDKFPFFLFLIIPHVFQSQLFALTPNESEQGDLFADIGCFFRL